MSISISTDEELDRILSSRASFHVPFPPEIALAGTKAGSFHQWMLPYELFGLTEHPLVQALKNNKVDSMIASSLAEADHLDRISHYSAWCGKQPVRSIDLTGTYPEGEVR